MTASVAELAQAEQLREVMARAYGITDTPTWDPAQRYAARPAYSLALRSPQTRRQILESLPPEARERRERKVATFTPDLDLDSPEIIETTVHGYVDRRIERADPSTWTSTGGPDRPRSFELWLLDQVRHYIPAGYEILGRWSDYARPAELLMRAQAADAAPAQLPEAVRSALARGMSAIQIAEQLGVSRARVYQLRDGKR